MVPSSPVPGSSEWRLFHMNDGPDVKEKLACLHWGMQTDWSDLPKTQLEVGYTKPW